jgi:hypothetical protein
MGYMSDVQYKWVGSDSIKKDTIEDSSIEKMTLRSSKAKGLWI